MAPVFSLFLMFLISLFNPWSSFDFDSDFLSQLPTQNSKLLPYPLSPISYPLPGHSLTFRGIYINSEAMGRHPRLINKGCP